MSTLLITGTTGFVGQHILAAALTSPSFSKVFSVTRRPIPSDSLHKGNAKLEEVILEDEAQWLQWPPDVLQRIGFVDACIWSQGIVPSKGSDIPYVRKVSRDYTVAGIRALLAARGQARTSKTAGDIAEPVNNSKSGDAASTPLRFIYLTGALTERNPDAKLYVLSEMRKARGEGEVAMLNLEKEVGREELQVTIALCGSILPNNSSWMKSVRASILGGALGLPIVPVSSLVETLFAVAIKGSEKTDLSNDDLCKGNI